MTTITTNENPSRTTADWGGNILAFLITIGINGLANGVPLGGHATGEFSGRLPSLFDMVDYLFSVWGLIYLGLAAFVVWQALPHQRMNRSLETIRIPFLTSCAANACWIFALH